jgi:hypothetical protein
LKKRHLQYRGDINVLAALLDPVNSLDPTDGGLRKPPAEWFSDDDLEDAYEAAEKLATAVGELPSTKLPANSSALSYGHQARTSMEALVANGFSEFVMRHSQKLQQNGTPSWLGISETRVAVVTGLRKSGHPALSAVADRVLSQHATVCAVDRFWSDLSNMIPSKRTKLAVAKADKMMLVRNAYRLRNSITQDDKEEELAF